MNTSLRRDLFVWAIFGCCVLAACAPKYPITVAGQKGVSDDAGLDVQEVVIRNLVGSYQPGELIFVSFGESWEKHVDPPGGFLDRITDVDVVLKPVSEYARRSGGNPLLLIVRVDKWISDTEARVLATRYRLGTGGAEGFTAEVKWSKGVWRMMRAVESWTT